MFMFPMMSGMITTRWVVISKFSFCFHQGKRLLIHLQGAKVAVAGKATLNAPRDFINLHVRGGFILPGQTEALNTDARWIIYYFDVAPKDV